MAQQKYETELRTGITGAGERDYLLFVFDGPSNRTIAIHHFATKDEAKAFHKSGTNYRRLADNSY